MATVARVIEGISPEPLKAPAGFDHYPLTEKEAEAWEKSIRDGKFKAYADTKFSAVVRDLNRVSVAAKLNNGTKDGKVQTLNLSLGTLSTSGYDDQKAMNIVELMKPVISKDVYNVQETKVSILSNDE